MRFAFPKKRKKKFPILPILAIFTMLMTVAAVFGESGLLHALSMRVVKDEVLMAVEEQELENRDLEKLIQKVQNDPESAQNFLAAYANIGQEAVVVYNFKSVDSITNLETLEEIDDLEWWQVIFLRVRILRNSWLEKE